MAERQPVQPALVTIHEIHRQQTRMGTALAVMQEKVKAIPDHENRVRRLEAGQAKLIGAAIAVSATVSALGTWVGLVVTHH